MLESIVIFYISRSNNVPWIYVKNGSKDLKRYPQISRRVRDTLAREDGPCWSLLARVHTSLEARAFGLAAGGLALLDVALLAVHPVVLRLELL